MKNNNLDTKHLKKTIESYVHVYMLPRKSMKYQTKRASKRGAFITCMNKNLPEYSTMQFVGTKLYLQPFPLS